MSSPTACTRERAVSPHRGASPTPSGRQGSAQFCSIIGHGMSSFDFGVAEAAIADGLLSASRRLGAQARPTPNALEADRRRNGRDRCLRTGDRETREEAGAVWPDRDAGVRRLRRPGRAELESERFAANGCRRRNPPRRLLGAGPDGPSGQGRLCNYTGLTRPQANKTNAWHGARRSFCSLSERTSWTRSHLQYRESPRSPQDRAPSHASTPPSAPPKLTREAVFPVCTGPPHMYSAD